MSVHSVSALSILQEHYPQRLRIPLNETAGWIGIAPGTARNHVFAGTFPIPIVRYGDLRLVDIRDLAAYLDRAEVPTKTPQQLQAPASVEAPEPAKRGRGRPRKIVCG